MPRRRSQVRRLSPNGRGAKREVPPPVLPKGPPALHRGRTLRVQMDLERHLLYRHVGRIACLPEHQYYPLAEACYAFSEGMSGNRVAISFSGRSNEDRCTPAFNVPRSIRPFVFLSCSSRPQVYGTGSTQGLCSSAYVDVREEYTIDIISVPIRLRPGTHVTRLLSWGMR